MKLFRIPNGVSCHNGITTFCQIEDCGSNIGYLSHFPRQWHDYAQRLSNLLCNFYPPPE